MTRSSPPTADFRQQGAPSGRASRPVSSGAGFSDRLEESQRLLVQGRLVELQGAVVGALNDDQLSSRAGGDECLVQASALVEVDDGVRVAVRDQERRAGGAGVAAQVREFGVIRTLRRLEPEELEQR